jgi:hypothetical protein
MVNENVYPDCVGYDVLVLILLFLHLVRLSLLHLHSQ